MLGKTNQRTYHIRIWRSGNTSRLSQTALLIAAVQASSITFKFSESDHVLL